MDRKILLAIIAALVTASIAMLAYVGVGYYEYRVNLKRNMTVQQKYEQIKNEIPIVNDNKTGIGEQQNKDVNKDSYCVFYDAPVTTGFKSYMDYRTITDETSKQYRLQAQYAMTGEYGIRMVNGRYCVAIGSKFTSEIGQYFDLILEDGVVIPCILADQKADEHTDSDNIITMHNGCMSEFVVDTDFIDNKVKNYGDMSYCNNDWGGRVVQVKVYDKNVFDEK